MSVFDDADQSIHCDTLTHDEEAQMLDGKTLTKEQARETVLTLLAQARAIIPSERPAELPGTMNSEGVSVPGWHEFEHALWPLGSEIWNLLTAHPALRGDDVLFEQIIAIATNPAAMRGRQSFILACGSVKQARYAPQIASQLGEWGVDGQIINTIYKMRVGDHTAQVRPFVDSPSAWIRKEAKRYLAKYENASVG